MARFAMVMAVVGAITLGAPAADAPADKAASHKEVAPLKVKFEKLTALRMHTDGTLLAGDGKAKAIKVIDAAGKQTATFTLPFGPESIDVAADGAIYCGGEGKIARLDAAGKVVKVVDVPKGADSPVSEVSKRRAAMSKVELRLRVSGIAVSGKDVFVAFGSGWSLVSTSKLYRFDSDLGSPKQLATGIRGCCQRCDIAVVNGIVHVAENTRHRVVRYDREGKVVGKWGKRSRSNVEGFGACCNPMNLYVGGKGVLYTAESGLARVKRYTPEGKFLGLVGHLGVTRFTRAGSLAASCSNIALAVARGGERIYVMDYKNNLIRVLEKKTAK